MRTIPRSLLLGSLTACLALAIYIVTIAPDITWANYSSDGAELITASTTLGIAHPPGYPTYILLGKLFSLLPFGTIAFRFNLFSAIAMSVAAAFSAVTAYEILGRGDKVWPAALAAGLTLAFSPLVWGQATVTEVYALNLAALSIFLWSLLSRRSPWLTGFFLGLAMTTHLTSVFMLPIGIMLTPHGQRGRLALGILIGLIPLLTLPLLARLGSPVIWGDPSTIRGWWWLVTAQLYTRQPLAARNHAEQLDPFVGLERCSSAPIRLDRLVLCHTWHLCPAAWPAARKMAAGHGRCICGIQFHLQHQ